MSKFKVGDRVAIYNGTRRVDKVQFITLTGGIVTFEGPSGMAYHPKQCRRLKPKKRREIWVKKPIPGGNYKYWETLVSNDPECMKEDDFKHAVRFIEARKEKP